MSQIVGFLWIVLGILSILFFKNKEQKKIKNGVDVSWPRIRNLLLGLFTILSGIALCYYYNYPDDVKDIVSSIIFFFFGFFFTVCYRYFGKLSIEQQVKLYKFFGGKFHTSPSKIANQQFMFLFFGILFMLLSLGSIFN